MARKYAVGKAVISTNVSIPVSLRYDAVYDEHDLHGALIELSMGNMFAESGMVKLLQETCAMAPSGSWIRDTVESVKPETLFTMLDGALGSTLDDPKSRHIFDMPVVAAIDRRKMPRHDADIDQGFLIRGKHELGTSTYETYITLRSVEDGGGVQIARRRVSAFSTNAEEVASLLICSRLNGIDISQLFMDREFFSSEAINALKKNKQKFPVPCKLTSGIKRAIAEYERHERPAASTYIRGGRGGLYARYNKA